MERARSRYTILGISDGLFLGLGLALGISFFHAYSLTFASVLLVGVSGALSNMFATYNAETFTTGQQLAEYKEALFLEEYRPKKLAKVKEAKNIRYATSAFVFTLIGSLIVLTPYAVFYLTGGSAIITASLVSLVVSLAILGFIGSYHEAKLKNKIKSGLKTIGIGLSIAALSAFIGFALSFLLV